jgi:hypothetical protein
MIVQKLREHPIGVGGEVVTRYQKYAMPNPDNGRPRGFPTPSGRRRALFGKLRQGRLCAIARICRTD